MVKNKLALKETDEDKETERYREGWMDEQSDSPSAKQTNR